MLRARLSFDEELERIPENMLPENQLFTRRQDHQLQEAAAGTPASAANIREPPEGRTERPETIAYVIQQDHTRIRAQVTVEGRPLTATLDTGASHSLICERLARELDDGKNRRAVQSQIKLADGTSREVNQALRATIQLGEARVSISVSILADVLDDLVIGMDFLCYGGATVQCGGLGLMLRPPTLVIKQETLQPSLQNSGDILTTQHSGRTSSTLASPDFCPPHVHGHLSQKRHNSPSETTPTSPLAKGPYYIPRRQEPALATPRPEPTDEAERPGILIKEEALSDEENLPVLDLDHESKPYIPAPIGWTTPDGVLPAELYGRVQERIRQAHGRSLRYLDQVGITRYRIQVSRNGVYVTIRLRPPKTDGV